MLSICSDSIILCESLYINQPFDDGISAEMASVPSTHIDSTDIDISLKIPGVVKRQPPRFYLVLFVLAKRAVEALTKRRYNLSGRNFFKVVENVANTKPSEITSLMKKHTSRHSRRKHCCEPASTALDRQTGDQLSLVLSLRAECDDSHIAHKPVQVSHLTNVIETALMRYIKGDLKSNKTVLETRTEPDTNYRSDEREYTLMTKFHYHQEEGLLCIDFHEIKEASKPLTGFDDPSTKERLNETTPKSAMELAIKWFQY